MIQIPPRRLPFSFSVIVRIAQHLIAARIILEAAKRFFGAPKV